MAERFLALDGLRGLLALYILAGHTAPFLDLTPAYAGLRIALSHGHAAVALFFVLSGLVILVSLQRISSLSQPVLRFLLARAGRLLPVHALALALAAVALSLGDPFQAMRWLPSAGAAHEILEIGWPDQWVWHLGIHALLLQGLLPPALLPDTAFTILGPAWSLSTEWQFYGLAALALGLFGNRLTAPAHLRRAVIALLLIGLLGLGDSRLPPAWQFGRAFLPQESWYFALGIASFALLRARCDTATRRLFAGTVIAACIMSLQGANAVTCWCPWSGWFASPAKIRLSRRLGHMPDCIWAIGC
jgi:peptidoglycan/LPS O-acetylase OafA/YrhL